MIISHEHQFIFIKTRKTAGTSIEIALSQHCGPRDIITPISPKDEALRRQLGYPGPQNIKIPLRRHTTPRDLYKFVRGKCITFYNHMPALAIRRYIGKRVWNAYYKFCIVRNPFDRTISRYYWSTRNTNPRPDLMSFLKSHPPALFTDWHLYTIDGRIVADRVGRYENMKDELARFADRIGLPPLELPRAKSAHRTDRRHYTEFLSQRERQYIEQVCRHEIEAFGYAFEPQEEQQTTSG